MNPTKLLIGQIIVVFVIVICGVWTATQWCADMLGYQVQLGTPWFVLYGWPLYKPWALFKWWYQYEAYAPHVFDKAGMLAGMSGFMGCAAAVIGSLWRARQSRLVTTYGSSRWATEKEVQKAGFFKSTGVFLGQLNGKYLRHDGPEHLMAFAPTRSGKGVGLVVTTTLLIVFLQRPNFALANRRSRLFALRAREVIYAALFPLESGNSARLIWKRKGKGISKTS